MSGAKRQFFAAASGTRPTEASRRSSDRASPRSRDVASLVVENPPPRTSCEPPLVPPAARELPSGLPRAPPPPREMVSPSLVMPRPGGLPKSLLPQPRKARSTATTGSLRSRLFALAVKLDEIKILGSARVHKCGKHIMGLRPCDARASAIATGITSKTRPGFLTRESWRARAGPGPGVGGENLEHLGIHRV